MAQAPPDDVESADDGLLILLPAATGATWRWRRVEGRALGQWHDHAAGGDIDWGDLADGARTVALVPAGDAPVRIAPRGEMPLAQALAAARLGAAESAGADTHVAVAGGPNQATILVATASTLAMDTWLGELATAGLLPEALVPAAAILPIPESGAVLAELEGQPLARTADAAFAGEGELVAMLAGDRTKALRGDELDEALLAAWRAPPLNLRQGAYAPRRVSIFLLPDWLKLARMAAVALLLGFLVLAVETVKLNLDARAREASALAEAQKRFPAAVDIASAQALASAELARRGEGGGAFAAPAAAVLAAMKPIPSLRLRDLGYASDGTLRFQAAAPTADDINRLLMSLQQEGWKVTVPPQLAPDPSGSTVAAITVRAP